MMNKVHVHVFLTNTEVHVYVFLPNTTTLLSKIFYINFVAIDILNLTFDIIRYRQYMYSRIYLVPAGTC